jgi:hypothetical protein
LICYAEQAPSLSAMEKDLIDVARTYLAMLQGNATR